jgi:hypothetical protein
MFDIMLDIISRINFKKNNQPFSTQFFSYFWVKLLYVFVETNKGRGGWQLKFTTNANWNKDFNLFYMSWVKEFKLCYMHNYFKPFSFNG